MWVRWAEQANASVDGENATVEIGDGTLLFPGGAALVVRLREVLHEPQPFAVLERELSDSAPAARVSQTLHALLNAQALTPWDVGRDLTLLHQQTVRGGEGSVLSPALETGRLLRDATGPATLLPYAESTGISLEQALRARRTCRSFRRCAASLEQLGSVLDLAAMPSPDRAPAPKSAGAPAGLRPYPSGGGLYMVEVAIYAGSVGCLDRSFYSYQPLGHSLVKSANEPLHGLGAVMGGHPVDDAAFFVLLYLDFGRVSLGKYGNKAYRLALLEAGHLAQNLLLSATACGLATLPLCGFDDEHLSLAAGLHYPQQPVIYAIAMGTAARAGDD